MKAEGDERGGKEVEDGWMDGWMEDDGWDNKEKRKTVKRAGAP